MIPHAEFERAINQWKIRQQGGQGAAPTDADAGAVMGEMPLANAEPGALPTEGVPDGLGNMRRSFDPE